MHKVESAVDSGGGEALRVVEGKDEDESEDEDENIVTAEDEDVATVAPKPATRALHQPPAPKARTAGHTGLVKFVTTHPRQLSTPSTRPLCCPYLLGRACTGIPSR